MTIPSLPSSFSFPGFRNASPTRLPGPDNQNSPTALRKVLAQGGPRGDQLDALGRRFNQLLQRLEAPGHVDQGDDAAVRAHAASILDKIDEAVRGGLLSLSEQVDGDLKEGVIDYADLFRGALNKARDAAASGDSFDLAGLINEVKDAFGQTVDGLRGFLGDRIPPGNDPFTPGGVTATVTTLPGDPGPTGGPDPLFGDREPQPNNPIKLPGPPPGNGFGDIDPVGIDGDADDGGSLRVDVARIRSERATPGGRTRPEPPLPPAPPVDPGPTGTGFADVEPKPLPAPTEPPPQGGLRVDVSRLRSETAPRRNEPTEPAPGDNGLFADAAASTAPAAPTAAPTDGAGAPAAPNAVRDALPQLFQELLQRFDSLLGELESLRDARANRFDRLS